MRLFRHPWWQHLDYRVKVATTQENKPPTQGTRQWTFTTPRWRCGSILLPSLNAGVPEPTGGLRCPRAHVSVTCCGFPPTLPDAVSNFFIFFFGLTIDLFFYFSLSVIDMCTVCIGRLCDAVPGFAVVSVNFQGPGARPSWQAVSRVELSAWRVDFGLSGLISLKVSVQLWFTVGTACGGVMELWHSLPQVDPSRKGSLRREAKLSVYVYFI